MSRLLFFLLCIHLCEGQPDELTGGATGDDGNQFVDGTANTAKILLGVNCVKDTVSSTAVKFEFYVNQGDENFKFEDASTTVRAGDLIMYEACYFIDAAAYDSASKTLTKATAHENCNNNVEFTTIDSNAADGTFERRTKTATLIVPNPSQSNSYKCGSRQSGTDIEVAVYCKRDVGYDKAFDVVFKATYGTDGCTATMVSPVPVEVENPPTVNVKYNLMIDMKAYKYLGNTPLTGPQSPSANEITVDIDLGTAMYLEICLKIPPVATGINNQFFEDGVSPIGIRVHTCTIKAPDNQDFQPSVEAKTNWPTIVDSNGCGTANAASGNNGLEEYFSDSEYIFKWVKDPNAAKDHLLDPNCFRSIVFPAISFARAKAAEKVDTIFTCKLDICTSSTDRRCFGNQAGGTQDYPTCPATIGRRKRETITVGQEIPEEMSVSIRVVTPDANTTSSTFDGCFEKKTFIGLTAGMMTLLLAILIAAIFLGVKLSTGEPEASTDSMTGIQNKAYY